jgi:hypothetical protein
MEELLDKEVSISKRIKVFNSIFLEFHNDLKPKFSFEKVKKFKEFSQFQISVNKNLQLLLKNDVSLIDNIKLFKKYTQTIKSSIETIPENKELVFKYIKNLYYLTFEKQSEADEIKAVLEMSSGDIHSLINLMMSGEDGDKVKKFIQDIADEIGPFAESLDIQGLENIDIQSLVSSSLNGAFQQQSSSSDSLNILPDNLSTEDSEKFQKLVELIREKIKQKIETGQFPKNEFKNLFMKMKSKIIR